MLPNAPVPNAQAPNAKAPSAQGLYQPSFEKDNCGMGFVACLRKQASHQLLLDALKMLARMDHRGGCGFEANTGDGAGILTNLPIAFFQQEIKRLFEQTVEAGEFAVGNVFLPTDDAQRKYCMNALESQVKQEKLHLIGWRDTPTDAKRADLGLTARKSQPVIKQLIVKKPGQLSALEFGRALYLVQKQVSHQIRSQSNLSQAALFYICSLSDKIIVYKGMLIGSQLALFFTDLNQANYLAYVAMIHSRFSTNTFPSWDRAQPGRCLSHNGEINTKQGNFNWMSAREGALKSPVFGKRLNQLLPVVEPDVSDSGGFDNVLEFLLKNGLSLQEAILMMIPEAWQNDDNMAADKKAFYQYLSTMMEPWDGPASIAFSDGDFIGAVLDRNGLRPSRYYLTFDDRVIMASEVGVVDVATEQIKSKGRLKPGRLFLVDFANKTLVQDGVIKKQFAQAHPYAQWLREQSFTMADLKKAQPQPFDKKTLPYFLVNFGLTTEVMQFMLLPLVNSQRDPLGSMGNDTPLACLSDKPRLLYDYFKQLFAQVTNPAIDSIREATVMSLKCYIGPEANLLEKKADNAQRLLIETPILSSQDFYALKTIKHKHWRAQSIDICYDKNTKLVDKIADIQKTGSEAVENGVSVIVLTDRALSEKKLAVSALLAVGALHQQLIKQHTRTKVALIVESGDATQVHHFCLLAGFGADAVFPYLAFEALSKAQENGQLQTKNSDEAISYYRLAAAKGMLKVMAKMGISTLASYKGAQIFEAVGLAQEVVDLCFSGTVSRLKGVGFDVLHQEALIRHQRAYQAKAEDLTLTHNGDFHWRSGGERHMWNPQSIQTLQQAAKTNDKAAYWTFANSANAMTKQCTLRGLLTFKQSDAIDLNKVESAAEIVKRFTTGAMSFGSISKEAHEGLAIAMNQLGGKSNTGEGGEDEKRWQLDENGQSRRSAIKQVASGRFGVTIDYLNNADEIQIKVAQGAKPGEGGELPGGKVDKNIARLRYSTPGVGLISPPPHHDIYSIEDLAQLIFDLKNANPAARISVKLVAEVGVGTIAAGVAKAKADHIVIAGHDGGTGASPLTSIKHAGLPWEMGLAETQQTLLLNGLRSRVTLQTDGQIKTGRDAAIALLLGAEEIGFSTAPLITMGCIMMRKCHLNTCPVGIATQDKTLRKKFAGKPDYVINYLFMVAEELRQIMAQLGFQRADDMIGRVDKLIKRDDINHWKAKHLDLMPLLSRVAKDYQQKDVYKTTQQEHQLEVQLDVALIAQTKEAVASGKHIALSFDISNTNRAVGTMLSSALVKSKQKLVPGQITIKLSGCAGQSLGAFLHHGVFLSVVGDANDYVAKGISGGKVAVYPPANALFQAEKATIAGNACCYGATSGEVYLSGKVAERFCVRNSGASAVVEGVGDHGCEYMTGGVAVILGEVGRNFAAGMSGGVAYVYDKDNNLPNVCQEKGVELEGLDERDEKQLKQLIINHQKYTHSSLASDLLQNWSQEQQYFVKVIALEYKKALLKIAS